MIAPTPSATFSPAVSANCAACFAVVVATRFTRVTRRRARTAPGRFLAVVFLADVFLADVFLADAFLAEVFRVEVFRADALRALPRALLPRPAVAVDLFLALERALARRELPPRVDAREPPVARRVDPPRLRADFRAAAMVFIPCSRGRGATFARIARRPA